MNARQAYRRVRKVIQLQWRGIMVVLLIITDVAFFAVIFVKMDNNTQNNAANAEKAKPWLLCLALSGGNKNACLDKVHDLVVNEATILAVLILLAVCLPRNSSRDHY